MFSINGNSKTANYLKEEFNPIACDMNEPSNLVINFTEKLPQLSSSVKVAKMEASPSELRIDNKSFSYVFQKTGEIYELFIKLKALKKSKKYLPTFVVKLKDPSNLDYHHALAKDILYDCFDYIFQNIQLKMGQTYIHASTVSQEGKGFMFPACGGVGKTTSMLKLLNKNNYKFLSDDLAVLNVKGQLFLNPKKIQVYAYNMQGEKWLEERVLQNRSRSDLFAWRYRLKNKGLDGVRRRMYINDIFPGGEEKEDTVLQKAFYLERKNLDKFHIEAVDSEELASKISYVLIQELSPYAMLRYRASTRALSQTMI